MASISSPVAPMVGLRNCGTVCYVNSALQQLYHMDDVRNFLVRLSNLHCAHQADETGGHAAAALNVCRAIGDLFRCMLQVGGDGEATGGTAASEGAATEGCPSVDPLECYKTIYPVIVRAQGRGGELDGGTYDLLYDREGDVSALLREVLCCVYGAMDGAAPSLGDCPPSSLLRGSLVHMLRVHGEETSKSETFFLLSLNVSGGSLSVALDTYFAPQEMALPGESIAVVRCALEVAPQHLLLHLKRISYADSQRRKVFSYFEYDERISLTKYALEQGGVYEYELGGVVVHEGGADSGHYYSFTRAGAAGHWRELDDEWGAPFDFANLIDETFGEEEGGAEEEPLAMLLVYRKLAAS